MNWIAVGVDGEVCAFATEEEAITHANNAIDWHRDDDYWDEDAVGQICVARLTHTTVKEVLAVRDEMTADAWNELTGGSDSDEWWEFSLVASGQATIGKMLAEWGPLRHVVDNVVPDLTEELGMANAYLAELKQQVGALTALAEYAGHMGGCRGRDLGPCTCGLDAARAALEAVRRG